MCKANHLQEICSISGFKYFLQSGLYSKQVVHSGFRTPARGIVVVKTQLFLFTQALKRSGAKKKKKKKKSERVECQRSETNPVVFCCIVARGLKKRLSSKMCTFCPVSSN